jgi:phosphoglycerate dehydrogenase-like enzyme
MPATPRRPVIVVEDDPFPRLLRAFLDGENEPDRDAAIADFVAHDMPDYASWLAAARGAAPGVYPADVRLVKTQADLAMQLADADALVVESLAVGTAELAVAPRLRVVQKYGIVLRNVDVQACNDRHIPVLTIRRRANIACAEHALALALALARRLAHVDGLMTVDRLQAAGYTPAPFDTRHVPASNWARIGGLHTLHGATAGILGLGEIGREVAARATAFGMRVLYHQRTPLTRDEERVLGVEHVALDALLAAADWLFVLLPLNASTRGLLGAPELARMRRGAMLVNVSRAAIVERNALLGALRSGHLGGLGLDSYYEEPALPDDPLLGCPNAILTPRVAAQPRLNAFGDLAEVMASLARALA